MTKRLSLQKILGNILIDTLEMTLITEAISEHLANIPIKV